MFVRITPLTEQRHGHGLDFVLTDSVNSPELDASFDDADVMHSSVSRISVFG